jgi:hypothetical protein
MTRTALLGAGDSLFVFTWDRVMLVYAPSGEFVRSRNIGGLTPVDAPATSPMRFLALRPVRFPPEPPPTYVMRLDSMAELRDSVAIFSPVDGSVTLEMEVEGRTVSLHPRIESSITAEPSGGFWTFTSNNYRLEWHDSLGTPRKLYGVRTAQRPEPLLSAAHFDSAASAMRAAGQALTQRRVLSASEAAGRFLSLPHWLDVDSTGLLWVTRLFPAPSADTIDLQLEYRARYEAPEEGTIPLSVEDRRYHSVIDVLDPIAGTRLAQLQLPFRAVRVRAGFVGRLTEDDDGFIVVRVYTLALRLPRRNTPSPSSP